MRSLILLTINFKFGEKDDNLTTRHVAFVARYRSHPPFGKRWSRGHQTFAAPPLENPEH